MLSRQPDWAFDTEILSLGALDQLAADLFEGLHFAGRERDADFVDFWAVAEGVAFLVVGHLDLIGGWVGVWGGVGFWG